MHRRLAVNPVIGTNSCDQPYIKCWFYVKLGEKHAWWNNFINETVVPEESTERTKLRVSVNVLTNVA